jgi:molybdopterin-guanine dinucleotide biosynthesis protein A
MSAGPIEAVLLTGGMAQRLGGQLKGEIDIGCGPLLVGELDAVVRSGIDRAVVVGPGPRRSPAGLDLTVTREDPPFGGPGAAVAAALPLLHADWTLLLACDLPGSDRLVPMLLDSWRRTVDDDRCEGVVLEAAGRPQWLAGIYRTEPLRRALAETPPPAAPPRDVPPRGPAIGRVLDRLRLRRVPDRDGVSRDVDTPDDLAWWTEQVAAGFLRRPPSTTTDTRGDEPDGTP